MVRYLYALAGLVLGVAVAGCGGSSAKMSHPQGGSIPLSQHVVMVMEENQAYGSVAGNSAAWPNLNKLMAAGAVPTNYYADTHPSIGNYFVLTTGQILTKDDSSTRVWDVDNLARRMIAAGVSFKVYAEGITRGYTGGDTGLYVVRHNPFALLSDVAGSPQAAQQYLWPFSQFAADAAASALPQFSFIVPNILHDAHSGSPLQADGWLQTSVVGPLSGTTAFQSGGDGMLIVDFDESAPSDRVHGGGHVAPVFWGPAVRSGYKQSTTVLYQHTSMLATIMAALGLSSPPGQASSAPLMSEFFVQ